jgi:hypothetical protein
MIKVIIVFCMIFAFVYIGIEFFRSMSSLEKWQLTKTAGYATIVAVVTTLLLTGIVILF